MCIVSAVMDYGRERIPVQQWTPETFGQFQQILIELQKLDAKLSQPDCEDPEKAKWMREVEGRLAKLEGTA
jgi:hypothetical protein